MINKNKGFIAGLVAVLLAVATSVSVAEQSQDFGEYVVHFNAITTDMLPPKVAREYRIPRSKNRAMLNIVVLQKVLGTAGQPVTATVKARATNLTGQMRDIPLREIKEPYAIYYIGDFPVSNEETLDFELEVTPEGQKKPLNVRFRQQFFTG